jgi:hypothetical protein
MPGDTARNVRGGSRNSAVLRGQVACLPNRQCDFDNPTTGQPWASRYGRLSQQIPVALERDTNQLAPSAHLSFREKVLQRVLDHALRDVEASRYFLVG